jgi:hypothetical protein
MDWMLALPSNGTSLFGICVSGGRTHVSTMFRWVFEGYFFGNGIFKGEIPSTEYALC